MRRLVMGLASVTALLVLSGCFGEVASNKGSFSASVQSQRTQQGTSTNEPPGRTVKGAVWKGTFTAKLTGPAASGAKKLKLKLAGGKFVAKIDGQEDFSIGKATGHALELITFKDSKTGSICAKVDYTTTDHGVTYNGTFKTLGGTGRLAKVKASGSVQWHPQNHGEPGPSSMTGKGSGTALKKAVALTADCKALKTL